MFRSALVCLLCLIAAPAAAQDTAADTVPDQAQIVQTGAEQPMGGIGISYSFATKHLPESRIYPLLVVELFVDPQSRVIGCSIIYPEETVSDEAYYCRRPIGKRTDFAAIGPNGNPAYGVGRVHVRHADADFQTVPADMEIMVSELPDSRDRFEVTVMAYIDETGLARNCQRANSNPELSLVACQLAVQHRFEARRGADGEFVPYVANLLVAFVVE